MPLTFLQTAMSREVSPGESGMCSGADEATRLSNLGAVPVLPESSGATCNQLCTQ